MKLTIPESSLDSIKGDGLVPLECERCGIIFHLPKFRVMVARKGKGTTKARYCSPRCGTMAHKSASVVACAECGKSFEKSASQINRTTNHFCMQRCAAIFNNRHKKIGVKRSRLEDLIVNRIRSEFPGLALSMNNRTILKGGYEVDILIESLKLAIEINGPTHFIPIYGQAKFARIQLNDTGKALQLKDLGFSLVLIDASDSRDMRRSAKIAECAFATQIKPAILERQGPYCTALSRLELPGVS